MPPDGRGAQDSVERAALAFSLLPTKCAEVVNRRLTIGERMRLREGLAQVRSATDYQRMEAFRALAKAVKGGMEWPRPSIHDEATCPFNVVGSHQRARVIEVFERVAVREPLEVAVALCHTNEQLRTELWTRMSPEARAAVSAILQEVHLVSNVRTRAFARDITARLTRAVRRPGNQPFQ